MDRVLEELSLKYGDAIAELAQQRYVCRFCDTDKTLSFMSGKDFASHVQEHWNGDPPVGLAIAV